MGLVLKLCPHLGILVDEPLEGQRLLAQPGRIDLFGLRAGSSLVLLLHKVQYLGLLFGHAAAKEAAALLVLRRRVEEVGGKRWRR